MVSVGRRSSSDTIILSEVNPEEIGGESPESVCEGGS